MPVGGGVTIRRPACHGFRDWATPALAHSKGGCGSGCQSRGNTLPRALRAYYGAGSPRETLKIISNAYIQAEGEIIDLKSVQDAQKSISEELMKYLDEKEILLLKQVYTKTKIPFSDELSKLLIKKVLLDYEDGLEREINPILLDNEDFINLIKA